MSPPGVPRSDAELSSEAGSLEPDQTHQPHFLLKFRLIRVVLHLLSARRQRRSVFTMQKVFVLAAVLAVCTVPATARAQTTNRSVQGFGGITFGSDSSFLGGTSTSSTFGGTVVAGLTPNLHAVGEFGRMTDIKPPLFNLLDFTPVGLQVSAWYGEGGVRFIASPHSSVRPYGEATAGFA